VISLKDLTKPATSAEVQKIIYELLARVGISTTSWFAGSVVRTLVTVVSIVFAACSSLIASIATGGFLELASGRWLDLVAYYVFGVTRNPSTKATGFVTLTNTGGGQFLNVAPGDLVVTSPTTGKSYRNTVMFSLGALATVTVAVESFEFGRAATALPGTVTTLSTSLIGVTVTNSAAIVGSDEESDSSLRERCLAKLGALSPNGPSDAYLYLARSATRSDGSVIGVTRADQVKDGFGNLTFYFATDSGGVAGPVSTVGTDLQIVDDLLQRKAAPLGITLHTESATPVEIAVVGEAWIYSTANLTPSEAEAALEAAYVAFMSTQPVSGHKLPGLGGGKIYLDAIRSIFGAAIARNQLVHAVLSTPPADVSLAIGEVPIAGNVSFTVHIVDPPPGAVS